MKNNVVPLFTNEELKRINYYRNSPPGVQRVILEVLRAAAVTGDNRQEKKEAGKLLRVLEIKKESVVSRKFRAHGRFDCLAWSEGCYGCHRE